MTEQLLDRALVEEATKKSGLIWVRGYGVPSLHVQGHGVPSRALWHVWHEGAAYVVGDGPGEQPLPGLVDGSSAVVTVRSKDKGGRLVAWDATVVELAVGSPEWEAAVAELKGKRLNAPDGEAMPQRWARECRVLRLEPTGSTRPLPDGDLAAMPLPTPATTREPIPKGLPRLLLKRRKR
ncbi:hypothetical protein Sipo8835_28210 [Streptomyces ipomoeae]|jgi:hypothetical protein|uniref:Pyridoxamine 5'-phosphate oxidase family protein n=2 Tax=Streptomyces ipomoeae TaxID=103232 RepID=L1L4K9_9ACTN|nr:hypothetical protein [Streptomyces ipomoeae]EKX67729.1 hypothetical protein STRIP9103_06536 [Streptomyces ipomoeae 91-03]MDX2698716.1 hypothetical protein [Streptomyces ipomoeae]MDX2824387.1 hypothetical protein [Streptomyces ipomoeae]MDX2842541.1 hypothetical protein [Streptomyces ipomoeae]MDX2878738.1 hypothetical protein [Streptomyces ipomoeae]